MAVARLFVSNNLTQEAAADASGLNRTRIAYANTVLRYAPELADAVMAGVESCFASLNGHDPVAYIVSANVNRRNLTTGQRAMAIVRMNSFLKNEFGGKQRLADEHGISRSRVSYASLIFDHASELADGVSSAASTL